MTLYITTTGSHRIHRANLRGVFPRLEPNTLSYLEFCLLVELTCMYLLLYLISLVWKLLRHGEPADTRQIMSTYPRVPIYTLPLTIVNT